MRSRDVRQLPCGDHLKEVVHRCLGARAKRYQAAGELITALRKPPKEPARGRVRSLRGLRVSITGFLSLPRKEAIAAARKAWRHFPEHARTQYRCAGPRPAQRTSGRGQGRRSQADGNPTAGIPGAPDRRDRRRPVLAPRGAEEALGGDPRRGTLAE
ncbi:MAG: hypothetical protein R2882_13745 [Gemmatimonadales bacterium]